MKKLEGILSAEGLKVVIIISRFNSVITEKLLTGAVDVFVRHKGDEKNLTVVYVPGSFEIPLTAKKLSKKNFDAVVCLGSVIRGETPHFDYIAAEVSKGIAQVSIEAGIPVSFGVITADTMEQATDRAGGKSGNKGADAMLSAIEMANLLENIK